MSNEIYYDRSFIRVGDDFVPIVNQGSSNCGVPVSRGRVLPDKSWQVLNFRNRGKLVYTEPEICKIAKDYEQISQDGGACYKSRNRRFAPGEFQRWILGGMKNALTVEEYIQAGNTLYIYNCTEETPYWESHYFDTTQKFLDLIEQLSQKRELNVGFLNERSVLRPIRPRAKKQKVDCRTLEAYYVIQYKCGYFCKWTRHGFFYTAYADSASSRKFETEKEAQRYLDKYKSGFGAVEPKVMRIAGNTAA